MRLLDEGLYVLDGYVVRALETEWQGLMELVSEHGVGHWYVCGDGSAYACPTCMGCNAGERAPFTVADLEEVAVGD